MSDLEVGVIIPLMKGAAHDSSMHIIMFHSLKVGYFPKDFVTEDTSPVYTLKLVSISSVRNLRLII